MEYYIVTNSIRVNNQIVMTEIGYVLTAEDRNSINAIHMAEIDSWRANNLAALQNGSITILNYFDENDSLNECQTTTSTLEGRSGLSLITNLTTLE